MGNCVRSPPRTNHRGQLFLTKPRPDETAEQFAGRVVGQLRDKGIFGEDGKLVPEVLEAVKRGKSEKTEGA